MNRLSHETSPYLLQHADNPVDWRPWGEEAFLAARESGRPVFLSIGYSSCHWCHVMEEESFHDPGAAALLNSTFVCVKVDREERPDVDGVYMRYGMAMTGSGGWPLTVLLTPEGKPFFAATYIPLTSSHGRLGLMELIPLVAKEWTDRREEIEEIASRLSSAVAQAPEPSMEDGLDDKVREACFRELVSSYDRVHGGFGQAPKFPTPHGLIFLLRHWRRTGEPGALEMAAQTLSAIRCGGIYDQIGFGIHRYSTDARWMVPHFEKMLGDQALFILAALEAFQATGEGHFRKMAVETAGYVLRDLSAPGGAFCSSEDADSPGGEGSFYTWSRDEMRKVLSGEDAAAAIALWGVAESGSQGHGLPAGRSVLSMRQGTLPPTPAGIERIRRALQAARAERPRPPRDGKVLADWNGLMVAALAKAGRVLDLPALTEAARSALDHILSGMTLGGSRVAHSSCGGSVSGETFLDDCAFLCWGALELYAATFETRYITIAAGLQAELDDHFSAPGGGYFFSGDYADPSLPRFMESHDGALPSGNSVTLSNLLALWGLTGEPSCLESARGIAKALSGIARSSPSAVTMLLAAPSEETVVHATVYGRRGDPEVEEMLGLLGRGYRPGLTVRVVDPEDPGSAPVPEALANGVCTTICRGGTCMPPARSSVELGQRLDTIA
jgi:uncharacterized protein YyaL (SSP411 family)